MTEAAKSHQTSALVSKEYTFTPTFYYILFLPQLLYAIVRIEQIFFEKVLIMRLEIGND